MGRTVFVVNHCNQWHEYSSFRLIGVFTGSRIDGALRKIQKKQKYSDQDMQDYIDVQEVVTNEVDL